MCNRDEAGNELHRRDFRQRTLTEFNPIEWIEVEVTSEVSDTISVHVQVCTCTVHVHVRNSEQGNNQYSLEFSTPAEGYQGFFMEVTLPGPDADHPELNFTTEMQIIPDVLPFPRCATPEECQGTLK